MFGVSDPDFAADQMSSERASPGGLDGDKRDAEHPRWVFPRASTGRRLLELFASLAVGVHSTVLGLAAASEVPRTSSEEDGFLSLEWDSVT